MKYILTGGGSGGHIYPALQIGEEIKRNEPDAEFLFVGTKGKLEEYIVPQKGYPIKYVPAKGMPSSKLSLSMFLFLITLLLGTLKSAWILFFYRPQMVIATGGFVSAPVVFSAALLKKLKVLKDIKIMLYEANSEPGKMISVASRFADGVGCAYKAAVKYFKNNGKFIGYPVRKVFLEGDRESARKELGIDNSLFVVFSVGGSQGARTLNRALVDALPHLLKDKDIMVIHGTGRTTPNYDAEGDVERRLKLYNINETDKYKRYNYINDIEKCIYAADVVVTRGGAGSLTEISVCGRASIVVPKAHLSGDHQTINGETMKAAGASLVIYEEAILTDNGFEVSVSGEKLAEAILSLKNDRSKINEMETSAKNIVKNSGTEEIYKFVSEIKSNTFEKEIEHKEDKTYENPYASTPVSRIISLLSKKSKDEILSDPHYDYLNYITGHCFSKDSWQARNRGVKLAGLLQNEEHIKSLSYIYNDKTRIGVLSRLVGGDYKQVGFIRRNVFSSYRKIGVFNDTVKKDLLNSLQDPYFEVVSESLKTIGYFCEYLKNNKEIKSAIINKFKVHNTEVLIKAVYAYSCLIENFEDFKILEQFFYHPSWYVRKEVLMALRKLKENKIIKDDKIIDDILDNILVTAEGYSASFDLKQLIKEIRS